MEFAPVKEVSFLRDERRALAHAAWAHTVILETRLQLVVVRACHRSFVLLLERLEVFLQELLVVQRLGIDFVVVVVALGNFALAVDHRC